MSKLKLILLIGGVIAIIGVIIFITQSSNPANINVTFTILDNQNVNDYSNDIINNTVDELFNSDLTEINVKVITASNNTKQLLIKKKPWDSDVNWKTEIRIAFEKLLQDSCITQITDKSANDLILQTLKLLKDKSKKDRNYYIISGSFPLCYNDQSSNELIRELSSLNKGIKTNSKVIWCIMDTRITEEKILKSLSSSKLFSVIDRRIIFPQTRVCPDNNKQNIYGIFFNPLNKDQANEFLKYLRLNYGDNNLTIYNNDLKYGTTLNFSKPEDNSNQNMDLLATLKSGGWESIGILLNQTINEISKLNDSTSSKTIMIVGNLPSVEGNAQVFKPDDWKRLKNIKNLSFIIYKPKSYKLNNTDKAFTIGLKYYEINFREDCEGNL